MCFSFKGAISTAGLCFCVPSKSHDWNFAVLLSMGTVETRPWSASEFRESVLGAGSTAEARKSGLSWAEPLKI